MTAAKIADLKNHLSAYLTEVRNGGEVIVLDREKPIAKIVPLSKWGDDFVVRKPKGSIKDLIKLLRTMKPVKTKKKIDWLKALRETREDRF